MRRHLLAFASAVALLGASATVTASPAVAGCRTVR